MNKVLVIILTGLSLTAGQSNKDDCKDVRTGTFENSTREVIIIRTKNKQIEKSRTGRQHYMQWSIKYLDHCEYLMFLDFDKSEWEPDIYAKGDTIKVSIGEVISDKYFWTAIYKGETF